jgi:hypothetical protein
LGYSTSKQAKPGQKGALAGAIALKQKTGINASALPDSEVERLLYPDSFVFVRDSSRSLP